MNHANRKEKNVRAKPKPIDFSKGSVYINVSNYFFNLIFPFNKIMNDIIFISSLSQKWVKNEILFQSFMRTINPEKKFGRKHVYRSSSFCLIIKVQL